jgi:acetyltransferase-like isoleucine patch superfamily enzyme
MGRILKRLLDACCLAVMAPCAWSCAIDGRLGDAAFSWWAQTCAIVPGLPGVFLRRAFYRLTLDRCAGCFYVGFGAVFSQRRVVIEEDVYVGPYAVIGSSTLRRGCLIGTRASVLSGNDLHTFGGDGRWTSTDPARVQQIEIGEHAWIGEAAVVMADVGPSAMVGAGSVVSSRVPPRVVVAGNPARFARHLTIETHEDTNDAIVSLR